MNKRTTADGSGSGPDLRWQTAGTRVKVTPETAGMHIRFYGVSARRGVIAAVDGDGTALVVFDDGRRTPEYTRALLEGLAARPRANIGACVLWVNRYFLEPDTADAAADDTAGSPAGSAADDVVMLCHVFPPEGVDGHEYCRAEVTPDTLALILRLRAAAEANGAYDIAVFDSSCLSYDSPPQETGDVVSEAYAADACGCDPADACASDCDGMSLHVGVSTFHWSWRPRYCDRECETEEFSIKELTEAFRRKGGGDARRQK